MSVHITLNPRGDALYIRTPVSDIDKCRALPQRRWIKTKSCWSFAPSIANIKYVNSVWPNASWSDEAQAARAAAMQREQARQATIALKDSGDFDANLEGVPFKHPPFQHQKKALLLGRDLPSFGYLMDQGTGKTKVLLDDAAHSFRMGRIDFLIVIAPNSVKTNWVNIEGPDEVANHLAPDIPHVKGVWFSQPTKDQKKHFEKFYRQSGDPRLLKILVVNVESLAIKRVFDFLWTICHTHKVMLVIDESTRIKTPGASRTKAALKLAQKTVARRIMSGTPVVKRPENAYAQFYFLDPDILGHESFYSFRNHYCTMGGYEGRQIISYKNLDELGQRISSASYRVLKTDCLDLPPKVYERRQVELSAKQEHAYKTMREEMLATLEEHETVTADIVMTQMLRLQQITGGYLPELDENGKTIGRVPLVEPRYNPKIQEAMEIIDEVVDTQKTIIWSRFRPEIAGIVEELTRKGISFVEFHGGVSESDRVAARLKFQNDETCRVFVGNPAAGGIGLNLFAASIAIYLSNSFATEDRIQSEDRCHRIGSGIHKSVTYYDIVATGTVDTKVLATLRQNKKLSDEIMRDGYKDWI